MRKRARDTTPPRVLPLLPIAFVAILVANSVVGLAGAALFLVGIEEIEESDDITRTDVALEFVVELVVLVALSFLLRWLVARWVVRHPPRPGTRELER